MSKVSEFEKLRFEVEENTKAIIERKEALEKELQEVKNTLVEKDAVLKTTPKFKRLITKASMTALPS